MWEIKMYAHVQATDICTSEYWCLILVLSTYPLNYLTLLLKSEGKTLKL